MRLSWVVTVAAACACTKPPAAPAAPSPSPSLSASPSSSIGAAPAARDVGPLVALGFRADRVRQADGAPKPDGAPDYSFRVRLSGEVEALVLSSSDMKGNPVGSNWWDTYRVDAVVPPALAKAHRPDAWTLGVYDHEDRLLNPEGTLPRSTFHDEVLTLYVSDSGGLFKPGYTLTLHVVRPDGTIDRTTTSIL